MGAPQLPFPAFSVWLLMSVKQLGSKISYICIICTYMYERHRPFHSNYLYVRTEKYFTCGYMYNGVSEVSVQRPFYTKSGCFQKKKILNNLGINILENYSRVMLKSVKESILATYSLSNEVWINLYCFY